MRGSNYNGPIKLIGKDISFYFNDAALAIHAKDPVPAKAIVEPSGTIAGWLPGDLGEWWGELLIQGYDLYHHEDWLGIWRMETDLLIGDIAIENMEKESIYTHVWFVGSGALLHD